MKDIYIYIDKGDIYSNISEGDTHGDSGTADIDSQGRRQFLQVAAAMVSLKRK